MGEIRMHARASTRRDWRLAALGSGCTIIGSACVLLAACSTAPSKPLAHVEAPAPPASPQEPAATTVSTSAPRLGPNDVSASPWQRLRQRFVLQDCDAPGVQQMQRRFTGDVSAFRNSLDGALPFLLVVLNEIERRDMPGEFAFLPYIESNYTALVSHGDRAAGIWQLMPDTAREAGLHINANYDGRLDIAASTSTALDLLERYHEQFDDWRLADMAFNAGEYGIAGLRGGNTDALSSAELARLRAPKHAHEHLAKLLAVSCVIADPESSGVELPEPQAEDELAVLDLAAPVDFDLVARIAAIDVTVLRHLNPGYLRGRMPDNGPFRLLLPAARRDAVASALDRLPQTLWPQWHEIVLQQDEVLDVLATAHGLDSAALVIANPAVREATLPRGTHLLVPGHGDSGRLRTAIAKATDAVETSSQHVVRAGDTLWTIARQARVRVADLLRWNGLRDDATLHLGQRLRLNVPETTGSSASGVAAPN